MPKPRAYGVFPSAKRQVQCNHTGDGGGSVPEPPTGPYPRYYGTISSEPPYDAASIKSLPHSDFLATCSLSLKNTGQENDRWVFAYPVQYGEPVLTQAAGFDFKFYEDEISIEGVPYRLYWTNILYSGVSVGFHAD